ncbi:hypothetical protein AB4Y85_02800 [Microvirga sp. 2YAF29]|uniref:hypothetical protein n=1 Tax=Microvirga sp. 2YAF29 TaxID=3233031 RepID=UPI003F9CB79F
MHSIVVVLVLMIAAPAPAQGMPMPEPAQAHTLPDCYCRAAGRIFEEGEEACLQTTDGPRIAQCSMELNVMSWRIRPTPCPES